jgi:lipopolysaccharide/colanic/teichoic acid biosynthesis glycosyltransferase
MGLIAVLIALTSGFPIFFRQTRVGKDRKRFSIYKFKTMTVFADSGDVPEDLAWELAQAKRQAFQTTGANDARMTAIGKLLRKTSLDELPQLINVIKGEMNLVGPRPDVPHQRVDYEPSAWIARHKVAPGITGLAQVSKRSASTLDERTQNDLTYVQTRSFWLDLTILAKTILQVSRIGRAN